ncbi:hypothetical protein [Nocardia sp. NPDC019395]|uniref:hypothetical protein n=1 Tax=Nocardia sp. NPDC019395 TaxID=3154686 RepID=UPI0034091CCC
MQSVRDAVRDLVDRSMESGDGRGDAGHGTVVISAGPGVVQWLATTEGVFHIEVTDPARNRRRTLIQRLRRRETTEAAGLTERELALLAELGFVAGDPNYELRPDEAELDRDHIVHVITTVLHDVFGVREVSGFSAEVF